MTKGNNAQLTFRWASVAAHGNLIVNGTGITIMKYKYPRTPHLPWSPGATNDDIHQKNIQLFVGQTVVVTEKMDGENTSIYRDAIHARSIDSRFHPSRTWVKSLQAQVAFHIPQGWRICGENLYARHSIRYENLPDYFMGLSVWDDNNVCLSWSKTKTYLGELNICTPKELYVGPWDEHLIRKISIDTQWVEGYVVRLEAAFAYHDFANSVAKWVRTNHVTTNKHWMHTAVIANGLKGEDDGESDE